ncbi:MAG: response regulator transcription factor [Saprospiraceae bacterium]|uniref:Response regulator transcription factor n=1 Tax=Candidatus Opimibacter skivensis TaxID=2982028 RepID=A0A9D7XNN4_9BACT|nr:response regulator transcription factor [Candidatus Opimibacter skivensis]
MNTLIIDDEPLALDVLETYISKVPELNLVARCSNALEANELLRKHQIDLIFLDIQMPQMSGVDLIKALPNPPLFIFTTAYSNYALEGYELNAIDYLLKPISLDRFMKAVNKALEQFELRHREDASAEAAIQGMEGADFFFVKADKKLVKIKYDEILYIEGLKDYVIIRLEQGRVVTLQTMKSLEDKLPASKFKRIHRSYIVSIDKIHAVDGTSVDVFEKGAIKQLPIGKNYRDEILEIVNRNKL